MPHQSTQVWEFPLFFTGKPNICLPSLQYSETANQLTLSFILRYYTYRCTQIKLVLKIIYHLSF